MNSCIIFRKTTVFLCVGHKPNESALIKSIKIPFDPNANLLTYQGVIDYNESFSLIVSTFNSTYTTLKEQFSAVSQFAQASPELIQIIEDVNTHVSSPQDTTY